MSHGSDLSDISDPSAIFEISYGRDLCDPRDTGATRPTAAAQSAPAAMLVRPARFQYNRSTAASNAFAHLDHGGAGGAGGAADTAALARAECEALAAALQAAGVRACLVEDTPEPPKPDAVFPNNWVSWHADGTIVLYPLQAANRRPERRADLVTAAAEQAGFVRRRLLDLSGHEREGRFLEGTGSLVLDHIERVAYACRSVRTHEWLLHEWARLMDYEPLVFDALADGRPLYHTNVMLAIGTRWVVVCAEAIVPADRARVLERLRRGGRELIDIDPAALRAFAGNVLELSPPASGEGAGRSVLVLSAGAHAALRARPACWSRLAAAVDQIVAVPVPTIETAGGGSVRCMLAEIPAVLA